MAAGRRELLGALVFGFVAGYQIARLTRDSKR